MTYQGNAIELIELETEYFSLVIKGKPVHPDIDRLYTDRESAGVKALLEADTYNCELESFSYYDPLDELISAEANSVYSYPFFYEQQDYQILIEAKNDLKLEFYHENRNIRKSVSSLTRKENILMGTINFRNDVGYSELEIRNNGKTLLVLKIEVFPSKIDYRNDYYKLLNEVNREVYNLTYDFFRSTFQGMKLKEAENISHVEFFSILQTIFDDFIKAYRRIEKSPHHRLNKLQKVLPSSRVKKINRQSIKWMRRNTQYYDQELGLPVKMLNIDKQTSFDTFENRFVKWIISELLKKLTDFEKRYRQIYKEEYIEEDVLKLVESMSKKLDFILKHSFLNDIGDIYKIDSLSLVLQMAPGYREVYKYYLMLLKGLSINGQIFRLSMKQIWELYEYWCFLELNRLLRDKYKLVKHNLIDINYSGIYVTLNKSSSSYVEYENEKTGETFKLSYNTSEGEGITTGQKPDNVLSLKKEDSETEYKFIFDAKYRINPAIPGTTYSNKHNLPGPEEDTINTMHRYRDAVVYDNDNNYEHRMVGAYVLFPYQNEEEFKDHTFYRSIDKVNVGAFPFLPGSTSLVAEFLENLIEESYLGNYERNVLPAGTADYRRDTDFEQNVLVGSIRTKEQLQFMLDQKIYYIPCKRVRLDEYHLEHIAVYLNKRDFPDNYGVRYYGNINKIEVKKRKVIDIPLTRNNGKESYYVFHIESWRELEENVLPEGYGVRGSHIYTNFMLLQKARTIPELSINTMEQWRIWLELKRVQGEIEILMDSNSLNQGTLLQGFQINDIDVRVDTDEIIIETDEKIKRFPHKDLAYNLRGVMKEIFKL